MPNIQLYTSNSLEKLADQLADIVQTPLPSPFKPEVIVVQSPGMERWISMQMAERLGIWSNCRYLFPNKIVSEIFSDILSASTDERLFDTDSAAWQIVKILPDCLSLKVFESLSDYLAGSEGYFRIFELASRIADTFDQYLTYRPDMILDWDKGNDKSWQAELWRRLTGAYELALPPHIRKLFFNKLKNPSEIDFTLLPERISVFGISTMPKYHLDILAALSDHIKVNIFFLNPCREYWADIYPEKNIAKTMGKYKDNVTSDELHLEKGNSLLASMGRLGGDFLSLLSGYDNTREYADFTEPERDSFLHSAQADILNMVDGSAHNGAEGKTVSVEKLKADNSIMIHSCHSPMRELEVLYDNLLDMFNNDPDLEPRDIIVMTPDIAIYSPYISAVFSDPVREEHKIPFSIADKNIYKDNNIIMTFFSVLDLVNSRFESTKVIDILENSNVLGKFGLTLSDLQIIKRWIKGTNINWGIDALFKKELGLPEFEENTWKAGFDRMLLGYAMPGGADTMYRNILPYDIEGTESVILGKFIDYFNSISGIKKTISGKYTLTGWSDVLNETAGILFNAEEDEENIQIIRDAAGNFKLIEEKSGFHEPVDIEIIKTWLDKFFQKKRITSGFLAGGVTFCAMLPMRSIPFKIICLIGMNDNAFPAADIRVSFDLIAQNPGRGDRSRRDDDRYLFLESIISAKEKLYISYIGQNIQDNSEIQPSVVVSELMDYIYACSGKELNIRELIFVKHPLQSFSSKYFSNGSRLFSYSEINRKAGMIIASDRKEPGIFVKGKLSDEYNAPEEAIQLGDLITFFINPSRHLLTTKLGIYLDDRSISLDQKEPFEIKKLQKYQLEDTVCRRYLEGYEKERLFNVIRSAGLLPHGNTGRAYFDSIMPGIKNFCNEINDITGENKLEPVEIDLQIGGVKLRGRLDNIWKGSMVQYRYAKTKVKDRLRAWISHIALNAAEVAGYPNNSRLVCKDASWEMGQVDSSKEILRNFLDIYVKGQNELVRFFPESGYEYAQSILKDGSTGKALYLAEKKWIGSDYLDGDGERTNEYYTLCFKEILPFDDEFKNISLKLFEPLIAYQKKI